MEASIIPRDAGYADDLPASLKRRPVYDILMSTESGQRQVQLITSQAAKGANPGELAQFLELCANYGLDPMAKEAWCVVSQKGDRRNVMVTVGRDGLRKIAQRQGMKLRGDVVRQQDEFHVEATEDGHTVKHTYGLPVDRGDIVGSWCRVVDEAGVERGFYFAPIEEYRPDNPNKWTPWHNQPSVMAQAASERQALSQSTPLSGLVAVGEMARTDEALLAANVTAPVGNGGDEGTGAALPPEVEHVIARATALGHAGYANRTQVELAVVERPDAVVKDWLVKADQDLTAFAAEKAKSAEVVDAVEVDRESLQQQMDDITEDPS